ncbi:MAG: hypothetical protein DRG09_00295 [Epsilonproteobacteria bacterium]|nr:MAG: hypothetical protein DRG09_00295 [Campylobacterota bacterium]
MLKRTLFLLLLCCTYTLSANDFLDTFIDEQIKIEAKFLDQNLSLDKKVAIKKEQESQYRKFFLQYAADKEKFLEESNPYRNQVSRLKLSINSNRHRSNSNAVDRDKVLLKGYNTRNMIRKILHDSIVATHSNSKTFYNEKVNEIIVKYLAKYKPLDSAKYLTSKQDQSSPIVQSLIKAVEDQRYLDSVVNSFSSALVEQSTHIYKTSRLADSKVFSILNTINTSPYGLKINAYLSPIHLDIAKVLLVLLVALFILIVQTVLWFILNRILQHYKLKEEDIEYIHTHITKLFNLITSVMMVHIILVSFLGMDTKAINISKLFAIFYVLSIALMLYRITNTIAYMKMEQIKKSKVIKNEVINLMIKVINGFIVIVAMIAILKIFGVNLTALLSGLGIAGAAIAFAAKDSIANIFASVSILLGDVFEQGDWIETNTVNGTVVEIGLRATTIRTFANALISIPNSELANSGVKNWSRRRIGRRIKMNIGVTYQSDFNDIRQAILDIREMLKEHHGIADQRTEYSNSVRESKLVSTEDYKGIKRTTLVYMDEFADSSINILVYCFSRTVDWEEWLEVKEDVMFKVSDILTQNNLEFAYPSLALYHPEAESLPDIESL